MLTGKDLVALGMKPGPHFAEIMAKTKGCATKEEAIELAKSLAPQQKQVEKRPSVHPSSVLQWLLDFPFAPPSVEKLGEASKSEKRRWLENRSVLINGWTPPPEACIDNQLPMWQLVFFPKGDRKTTMIGQVGMEAPADANLWFDCEGSLLNA